MRDDSRQFGSPAVAPDPTAGWKAYAWAMLNLLGQDKEHSPRGTNSSTQTLAASGSVNPLAQLVLVTGTATATLESAVAADRRWHLFIHDIAAGGTVTVAGTPTINGAASVAIATRYACLMVWSDGAEWKAQQTDLSTALGTLAVAKGGTGAATASAAWKTLSANQTPLPLMAYGGMNFNGTTTYLDTNALTGIADGKKFSWVGVVRFAGAASASENLINNTGVQFQIIRTSTGNIQVVAENAAGVQILNQVTTGTPCAAAGTYVIECSADMGTAASFLLYINDVAPSVTSTTFTDDTIDFTVTEWSVGATVAGANFFNGDFYSLWFNTVSKLNFASEAVRRRFADSNNVPQYLGNNGELPTGSRPTLFLGYGNSDTWAENRGSATSTSFTKNGTIADATTALNGQFAYGITHTWTPTRTSWTDVGAATTTGRYSQHFDKCFFQVKVVPGTTTATAAGTSYVDLPLTANPADFTGDASMENATTLISVGGCVFDLTNGRCYVPTQAATGNTLELAGWYPV